MHSRREIDERDESPCYHLCTAERRDESAQKIGRVGYFAFGFFDGLKRRVMRAKPDLRRTCARCVDACASARGRSTPALSAETADAGPAARRVGIALYEIRDIYI
jgi:hypothetical protein